MHMSSSSKLGLVTHAAISACSTAIIVFCMYLFLTDVFDTTAQASTAKLLSICGAAVGFSIGILGGVARFQRLFRHIAVNIAIAILVCVSAGVVLYPLIKMFAYLPAAEWGRPMAMLSFAMEAIIFALPMGAILGLITGITTYRGHNGIPTKR